ncbi:hypothetical protein BDK51DRAFT_10330, partial [Blyttiomyces helicus]
GVWPRGSYWHLDTRRDELARIRTPWTSLRVAAEAIDERTRDPRFETLVHGDPKADNIAWGEDDDACVLYDFQYTGVGLGARDVAYLICSSADATSLSGGSVDRLLDGYFEVLVRAGTGLNGYTRAQFADHFNWCLLDYVRFMAGWGWWGNHRWAVERTRHLL